VQAVVGAAAVIGVAPQSGGLEGGHEHLEGVEQDRGGHRVSSKWSTVRGSRAGSSAASAAARESPHRAVRERQISHGVPFPASSRDAAITGVSPPESTVPIWQPTETPVYRTCTGNCSANQAACGP